MKHTLGNLCFALLFIYTTVLYAEDFSYAITPSKHEAYLHEPLLLHVDLNQTNPDVVLLFQFAVNKNKSYTIRPLFAQNDDTLHHTSHHYAYVIYPLETGDINITFSLTKRVTNEAKVAHFASGDRDDFKKLETKDYPVSLPPVHLHIKPLPPQTQIVGDYTLSYHVSTHEAAAYTPISMQVTLKGEGFPPELQTLIPKSKAYEIFNDVPKIDTMPTPTGFLTHARYLFALSADKSFTLPPVTLHAFNPKTASPYTLEIPEQSFHIQAVDKKRLVDKSDVPAALQTDFSWLHKLWIYAIIFLAGYLSALVIKSKRIKSKKSTDPFIEKIHKAKDAKTLLQLLMAKDAQRFSSCIQDLEHSLYQNAKIKLSKVKKEAIDLL